MSDVSAINQRLQAAMDAYQAKDDTAALALCRSVLTEAVNRVDAWTLLGMLYRREKKTQLAIDVYQHAVKIDPTYVDASNNLGNLYREEGRFGEAIVSYLKALEHRPAWPELHNSIAATYQATGRLDEAFRYFEQALRLAPDNPDIHWDYSLCLLLAGRYAEGWQEYEWRWQRGTPLPRGFAQPFWQGESLAGKTVLVYDEQGHGDGIQFLRFVPLLERYGGRVILETLGPLHALIRESMRTDWLLARGEPLPSFDCHIPLLSLPRILHTTPDTIPATPYLRASAERIEYWRQRLTAKGLRVGLTWAGNPNVKNDHWRSPRLQPLLPLLNTSGVTFYGIQMGDGRRDLTTCGSLPSNFVDLGDDIRDFADTAAILSQLDLLITTDTSVAHLAGALGKKTWVMLHATPDWRWMLGRNDSPWYSTLTLYRQVVLDQWQEVVQKLAVDLEALVCQVNMRSDGSSMKPVFDASVYEQQLAEGERLRATNPIAAKQCFERYVETAPRDVRGWEALANVYYGLGETASALMCIEKALALQPDAANLWVNLALLQMQERQPEQAHVSLRKAQALKPADSEEFARLFAKAHSNFVCNITYDPDWSAEAIFAEHSRWGEYNRLPTQQPFVFGGRTHRRKLRLGLVSADLYSHPVGILLYSVLEQLDKVHFEVYCYAEERNSDRFTASLRDKAAAWRNITALTDEQLAECVYMDAIDVLIDLSGHTGGNRLRAFTRKPAPVQLSFLGYWETTGVAEIDYVVSDSYSLLPEDEPYFVERVLRLPDSRFCYRPPLFAPEVRLKGEGETVIFGCFNNSQKLNRYVVHLWADILHAVTDAKLLLKWKSYDQPAKRQDIVEQFSQLGIGPDRLMVEGASTYDVLLDRYNEIDIALDPFPFNGGLTTCDALWMGVPVITLAGRRPIGRQSVALLSNVGCIELIAQDEAQYRAIAINLARDEGRRIRYKQALRQAMKVSPLMDAVGYTRKLEKLLLFASRGAASG